jgi:hypothetical protein
VSEALVSGAAASAFSGVVREVAKMSTTERIEIKVLN